MTKPGILHVMKLLDISYEWLAEMEELDSYEEGVVHGTQAKILDSIANLEAIL